MSAGFDSMLPVGMCRQQEDRTESCTNQGHAGTAGTRVNNQHGSGQGDTSRSNPEWLTPLEEKRVVSVEVHRVLRRTVVPNRDLQ